jgi:hypothetical protein
MPPNFQQARRQVFGKGFDAAEHEVLKSTVYINDKELLNIPAPDFGECG